MAVVAARVAILGLEEQEFLGLGVVFPVVAAVAAAVVCPIFSVVVTILLLVALAVE